MDVKLYTGNGSTQTISGLGFSPDLVWIKNRAAADNHKLTDIVRGATEELESNTTDAEATNADGLTQFNADGFDLGDDDEYNTSAEAYVAWAWDAGSSTVTNTVGSISSQVRANASAGFSIVSWVSDGAATQQTVGHGLGVAPALIIQKNRSQSIDWYVYSTVYTTPANENLRLNTTGSLNTDTGQLFTSTSSVFGARQSRFANAGESIVAYCFAPVAGYSSFGSWTGSGSSNGSFIYTGFAPRWILARRTDVAENWVIWDSSRETYNPRDDILWPHSSQAEITGDGFARVDFLSNGFKFRNASFPGLDGSGAPYIYAAFAESCFALNNRAR
jgi:hypothetical protein